MIGCLRTRVRNQPIIALYFEFENELKFDSLEALFPSQELGFVAPNSTKEVANKNLVQTFPKLQSRVRDSNQNHQIASYFIFEQCILPHFAQKVTEYDQELQQSLVSNFL